MFARYVLPLLAIAGLGMAVYTVMADNQPKPSASPVVEPAAATYKTYVAGAGLVEASTENIAVSTPISGVVVDVDVKAGVTVERGAPLFRIDDRTIKAELASRKAELAVARAEVARLNAQPRPEDLPPAEARVAAARAILDDLESQLAMWERADPRAVAGEELSKRRFAVVSARANLREAEADLARLRAGAWSAEVEVARAQVESAQARVDAAQVELDRHTVTAPVGGEVLKVNVRPGEFVAAAEAAGGASPTGGGGIDNTQIVLGNTQTLHVRVDVDENDAWRVKRGAKGEAFVRGNPSLKTSLEFVRFEPFVIPKKSLTGASTERVDTRVLQVIFKFDPKDLPVFVGQQMDVFIEAPGVQSTSAAGTPDSRP